MKRGSISVFFSLLLLIFLGFTGTLLEMTRLHLTRDLAEEALCFGEDELLTHYYLPLYERYHLFGLVLGEEEMSGRLEETVRGCLTEQAAFAVWNTAPEGTVVDRPVSMEDYGGALYRRQIAEYEKYHVLGEKAQMPDVAPLKEQGAVMEILADRTDLCKAQTEASADLLALYSCVEGLKTTSTGLARRGGAYVAEKTFVKKFLPEKVTMDAAGVTSAEVFRVTEPQYVEVPALCQEMAEEGDDGAAVRKAKGYAKEAEEALKKLEEARKHLEKVKKADEALEEAREAYRQKLLARREELTEATFGALWEDACAESSVLEGIGFAEFSGELDRQEELLGRIKEWGEAEDAADLREMAERLAGDLGRYSVRRLRFRYAPAVAETRNLWEYLMTAAQPGLLDLFFGEGERSQKSLAEAAAPVEGEGNLFALLANRFRESGWDFGTAAREVTETFLQERYAAQHMRCLRDGPSEEVLDYQYEYLLGGSCSDEENLRKTAEKILLCRMAVNYLAVLTDPQMREQAELLSRALVGVTLIEPLVQGAKHLILLAWAAEESVVELRALSLGRKVSWWKRGSSFLVRYEDLFAFSQEMIARKAEECMGSGPDYEGFLCAFFWLQDRDVTTQRMLHLTESNIAFLQGVPFRMSGCLVGFRAGFTLSPRAKAAYAWPGTGGLFREIKISNEYGYR